MSVSLTVVDAFTKEPFAGNPAAVCRLEGPREASWMQAVAGEMNLSETAFVWPLRDGRYSLRWFTPSVEVDLCGHATLATAHTLWRSGVAPADEGLRFATAGGELTAVLAGGLVELDFPSRPAVESNAPEGLLHALGLDEARWIGRSQSNVLVEVAAESVVRGLTPEFSRLERVDAEGVMVTARADSGGTWDFVSRFFAPREGIDEDPVTGSAHCTLGPYWGERLGSDRLTGLQTSARGGVVRVRLAGARVVLAGRAVTVVEGALLV